MVLGLLVLKRDLTNIRANYVLRALIGHNAKTSQAGMPEKQIKPIFPVQFRHAGIVLHFFRFSGTSGVGGIGGGKRNLCILKLSNGV